MGALESGRDITGELGDDLKARKAIRDQLWGAIWDLLNCRKEATPTKVNALKEAMTKTDALSHWKGKFASSLRIAQESIDLKLSETEEPEETVDESTMLKKLLKEIRRNSTDLEQIRAWFSRLQELITLVEENHPDVDLDEARKSAKKLTRRIACIVEEQRQKRTYRRRATEGYITTQTIPPIEGFNPLHFLERVVSLATVVGNIDDPNFAEDPKMDGIVMRKPELRWIPLMQEIHRIKHPNKIAIVELIKELMTEKNMMRLKNLCLEIQNLLGL